MGAVLLYHSVSDDPVDPLLQVRPSTLHLQLRWATDLGWEVAPLAEVLAQPCSKLLGVTFDDGYADIAAVALELCHTHAPPTVFVCPGRVGGSNTWSRRQTLRAPLLSWSQLHSLLQQGVGIGCHGWDHTPFLGRRPESLAADIDECQAVVMTELGLEPQTFAYPFGEADPDGIRAVGERFALALTVEPLEFEAPAHLSMPRVVCVEEMSPSWLGAQLLRLDASSPAG